jgi:hypothetical protein
MMEGLVFLPVPDLTNGIHLLRTLRIYCSDCYIFEWNPDVVQLFTWVRGYREGTVHEEGLGIG